MRILLLLAILIVVAVVTIVRRTRSWALGLAVLSAAWLPANNGRLEGPVLVAVNHDHGLTLMDMVGYGGMALAFWVLYRSTDGRRTWRWVVLMVLLVAVALVASYLVKPGS